MSAKSGVREWLVTGAEVGVAALAALYALGFLVVHVCLAFGGYPVVGEFRVRYIAAGLTWLLVSAGPLLLSASLYTKWLVHGNDLGVRVRDGLRALGAECWPVAVFYCLLTLAVLCGSITHLTDLGVVEVGRRFLIYVLRVLLWNALIAFGVVLMGRSGPSPGFLPFLVAVLALFGMAWCYAPMQTSLPPGLGGSWPVPARFVLKDRQVLPEGLEVHQITSKARTPGHVGYTLDARVLDETPSTYVLVANPRGRRRGIVMELARDQVVSVVYAPRSVDLPRLRSSSDGGHDPRQ
jgi:hypothetical protein